MLVGAASVSARGSCGAHRSGGACPEHGNITAARAVGRGLRRRCPICGSGGTFRSWYVRHERCPTCSYPTTRVSDQWIGAFGMNIIVSFTMLVLTIAAGFTVTYPDPPVGTLLISCLLIAVGFPVLFQPVAWSLWSGIDAMMQRTGCGRVAARGSSADPGSAGGADRPSAAEVEPSNRPPLQSFLELDLRTWPPAVREAPRARASDYCTSPEGRGFQGPS